ncbi:MAG: 30S ribosomal protein S28e [Candidatus Aenigmarchaeota archaeon]|nr:30S ribosomal protein S28e [Candidatus Aenigmarchaeota archaeon]
MAVPAEVLKVLGRMGIKGVSRVRCRITDGPEKGKMLTRNVVGPIREGDIVMVKETEMESVGSMRGR